MQIQFDDGRNQQPVPDPQYAGYNPQSAIGLGDLLKRLFSGLGIQPCGGCEQRAQWLNEHAYFRRPWE